MIKTWKVFNFKSVRRETELEFAPLTIFSGANSSGKSTVLQSILIVAQTLAHKVSSRSVVLNGVLARLGQFDDIRSLDSSADQIVIGWTCEPRYDSKSRRRLLDDHRSRFIYRRSRHLLSSVSCEISFDTDASGAQKEITQIQPRLFSSQLSALSRDPEGGDRRSFMTIHRIAISGDTTKQKWMDACDSDELLARTSLQYEIECDEDSLTDIREEFVSAVPVGCLLRHFLPERLSLGIDMTAEDIRTILNVLAEDGPRRMVRRYHVDREIAVPTAVVDFILNLATSVSDDARETLSERLQNNPDLFGSSMISLEHLYEALHRVPTNLRRQIRQKMAEEAEELEKLVNDSVRDKRNEEPAVIPFRLPNAIAEASWYLDHFFSTSVRYLGPLRDEPKSLYPLAPTADPSDVGTKGEHTAAVLELHKNKKIQYIRASAFKDGEIKANPTMRSLEAAVVDWLNYLGVAEAVYSEDKGKFGHELKISVTGSNRPHDLTHVGVGVSQVLPILVASLLADSDTTLIFEQPELHLHPKVQTLLADFFLSMTLLGKQCIVETHSEYLVNRLRFRTAAADKNNPWVSAVKVYFAERPQDGSVFREVEINEYGAVLDWPEGFFDQSQQESEAILRAAAKKRKARKRK
jgi:predicted ATPase